MELQELKFILPLIKDYGFLGVIVILLMFFINKVFGKIFSEYLNYNKEMLKERNNHLTSTNLLACHLQTLSEKMPDAIHKINLDVISLKVEISLISEDLKKVVTTEHFDSSNEVLHQTLIKINEKLDRLIN